MRRSSFVVGLALVLGSAACTVNTTAPAPIGQDPEAPAPTPTTPGLPGAVTPAALPFKPSNIDISDIDVSKLGDVTVTATCELSAGDDREAFCGDSKGVAYKLVDQPGAGKIGVFVARSIRVEPNARITIKGTRAIAIVALDTFDVRGSIDASASWDYPSPGGFKAAGGIEPLDGAGPSAGKAGTLVSGAGGGGHCGNGGAGGAADPAEMVPGGATQGSDTIVPLVGGSSGGKGHLGAGSGGGAIQLVAGKQLVVAASASISANGGGGTNSGAVRQQPASGGGAGGAILLEGTKVSVLGKLSANGGAGGGNRERGQDGRVGETPAESPYTSEGSAGGSGSAGETIHGGDAIAIADRAGTGGGGAAGRIRVNGDTVEVSGLLSPRLGPCAVQGSLKK